MPVLLHLCSMSIASVVLGVALRLPYSTQMSPKLLKYDETTFQSLYYESKRFDTTARICLDRNAPIHFLCMRSMRARKDIGKHLNIGMIHRGERKKPAANDV